MPPIAATTRPGRAPGRTPSAAALVTVLAVSLASVGGCGRDAGTAPAAQEEPRRTRVRVLEVRPEPVTETLELAADLHPARRAVLAAEVPGTVETLRVEDGQRVAAGELLATVDTRALQQNLAEAEALYEQAADEHRRAEALFERRSVTRSALVEAETGRAVAEARLASAQLQLEKSRVRAPWAGTVAVRRVEVGDYVVPGQAMIELVDASRLKVRAPVAASDVSYVQVGEPVEIQVSSLPGERFDGSVVRLAAELDPAARTLDLEAEIPNRDGRLKPGMLARLRIARRRIPDALVVPLDAVVDMEDRKVVYAVAGGEVERRDVTLGPVLAERVVIESGLAPGDRVVIDGQTRVAPGQAVEAVEGEGNSRAPEETAP